VKALVLRYCERESPGREAGRADGVTVARRPSGRSSGAGTDTRRSGDTQHRSPYSRAAYSGSPVFQAEEAGCQEAKV
jgi:hypothetical protein